MNLDTLKRTSLWIRRMTDGRALVLGVVRQCPLPDGVNDAVVSAELLLGTGRDETANGRGRSYEDILETGWKAVSEENS